MMEAVLPFSSAALSRAVLMPAVVRPQAVAGEEVVGAEAAGFGVVVQVPFNAQAVDGYETQTRDDRR